MQTTDRIRMEIELSPLSEEEINKVLELRNKGVSKDICDILQQMTPTLRRDGSNERAWYERTTIEAIPIRNRIRLRDFLVSLEND